LEEWVHIGFTSLASNRLSWKFYCWNRLFIGSRVRKRLDDTTLKKSYCWIFHQPMGGQFDLWCLAHFLQRKLNTSYNEDCNSHHPQW
jgi:hypothetical protein